MLVATSSTPSADGRWFINHDTLRFCALRARKLSLERDLKTRVIQFVRTDRSPN